MNVAPPLVRGSSARGVRAFSLIELITAAVVFVILGLIIAQLLSSATKLTGLSNKKQEADVQARLVFSRMALDFAKMVRRPDVEYFLQRQPGNDRMAFLSEVTGYYPSAASPGALSVVAYRLGENTTEFKGLERLSKGLSWIGDATGESPAIFHQDIGMIAPAAVGTAAAPEYEEIGPGVFRLEYFYVLKNGRLSENPWDVDQGHSTVEGFRDVESICVAIAVVDPAVFSRVTPAEMRALAAKLPDFSAADMPTMGELEKAWQAAVNQESFSQKSGGTVRIHTRCFPLKS